jgi:hypothetical protein
VYTRGYKLAVSVPPLLWVTLFLLVPYAMLFCYIHETYQEIGKQRLPFDDVQVARDMLQRLTGNQTHA